MKRLACVLIVMALSVMPLRAETPDKIERLIRVLGVPEIIDVMREEGIRYGEQIGTAMFPARADGEWRNLVDRIHDADWMLETVRTGMAEALEGEDPEPIIEFFESPLGQEIVALEISARRALLDPVVEEANKAHLEEMRARNDPRLDLIRRFIETNELVEFNVAGTMNSDYAFYLGLNDGGAYDEPITEDEILSEIWSGEEEVRKDTEDWMYAYLTMAYSPLTGAQLSDYIEFSATPAGRQLNAALFAGFDDMFAKITYRLGRAAGVILSSDNL